MSKMTIAETGWADHTIDALREALRSAEAMRSDMEHLRLCDVAGCGHMFDIRDKRSCSVTQGKIEYHFCPACEIEAKAKADLKS